MRLMKAKPDIVRSLEVTQVLPFLKRPGMFTAEDEATILADPRRREQIEIFIKLLETKSDETFQMFCEVLAEKFPHLYLMMSDWEDDSMTGVPLACDARLHDEWDVLHRHRDYLISQLDAAKFVAPLRAQQVLSAEQERQIVNEPNCERRTEIFLDMLEMKPPAAYDKFLELMGEMYPHIYLALTSDGTGGDDW